MTRPNEGRSPPCRTQIVRYDAGRSGGYICFATILFHFDRAGHRPDAACTVPSPSVPKCYLLSTSIHFVHFVSAVADPVRDRSDRRARTVCAATL